MELKGKPKEPQAIGECCGVMRLDESGGYITLEDVISRMSCIDSLFTYHVCTVYSVMKLEMDEWEKVNRKIKRKVNIDEMKVGGHYSSIQFVLGMELYAFDILLIPVAIDAATEAACTVVSVILAIPLLSESANETS